MASDLDDLLAGQDTDSDELEIDLSGAVEFSAVEKGRYLFLIREAEGVTSKDKPAANGKPARKGQPCLQVKTSRVDDDAYGPIMTLPLQGEGAGRTKTLLRAVGWPVDNPNIKLKPSKLLGRQFWGTVGPQKSNPDYLEFKKLEPVEGEDPLG